MKFAELSDDDLIKGCGQNNRKSQEMFYQRYAKAMYNLCLIFAGDRDNAKDILYKKFNLGVRFGSEIEILLYDHFSIAPGLFLSYGIPNIYKGNSIIPGNLIETHNGSAAFHLTFYYHFD